MSRLPAPLVRELEDLGRFEIRHQRILDEVVLSARVRGVAVVLTLDVESYPAAPPRIELGSEWSWRRRPGFRRGRHIGGLTSQQHWNRTLGIGALLRELEKHFGELPPVRRKKKRRARGRKLVPRIGAWLRRLKRRLFGRRRAVPATDAEAIRARYEEIIVEETSRIERYKQAVAYFMSRWRQKKGRLDALGAEIERLEERRDKTVAETERVVGQLEAAGKSPTEIKSDALYERCLVAFEACSTELRQRRQHFEELRADARQDLEKIHDHEAQLLQLARQLQRLEEESAEATADLAAAQLEQEVLDGLTGIRRGVTERQLEGLRRQVRKAEAVVRVSKEATELDGRAQDAEYLEVGRRFDAAEELEARIGLGAAAARREEPLAE